MKRRMKKVNEITASPGYKWQDISLQSDSMSDNEEYSSNNNDLNNN